MTNLVDQLPNLRAPLLGLFGEEDKNPDPAAVAELTRILGEHGKDFTPHSYPDAGHGFFATDRISYRVAAANDGWERITAFFANTSQPTVLPPQRFPGADHVHLCNGEDRASTAAQKARGATGFTSPTASSISTIRCTRWPSTP